MRSIGLGASLLQAFIAIIFAIFAAVAAIAVAGVILLTFSLVHIRRHITGGEDGTEVPAPSLSIMSAFVASIAAGTVLVLGAVPLLALVAGLLTVVCAVLAIIALAHDETATIWTHRATWLSAGVGVLATVFGIVSLNG
jgi:hypothetical protein